MRWNRINPAETTVRVRESIRHLPAHYLILYERNEGREDHGQAGSAPRGQLVHHRFPYRKKWEGEEGGLRGGGGIGGETGKWERG